MTTPWRMPYLIGGGSHGATPGGVLTSYEHVPFQVQRAYWITNVGDWRHWFVSRGGHAHRACEQLFFCLRGMIDFECTDCQVSRSYRLADPNVGLYLPPMWWHTMKYRRGSICLAFASLPYDERDYIRNFAEFNLLEIEQHPRIAS